MASIYAWTRGVNIRGKIDGTPEVVTFADTLEQTCVSIVESGKMTTDLASLIGADDPFLTTDQFMDAAESALKRRMH